MLLYKAKASKIIGLEDCRIKLKRHSNFFNITFTIIGIYILFSFHNWVKDAMIEVRGGATIYLTI